MAARIPNYRLHKSSGQALVQLNGQRIYLGKYQTDESREKYRRLLAEWLLTSEAPPETYGSKVASVNELSRSSSNMRSSSPVTPPCSAS
jgi:hypothetical protein